MLHLKTPVSEHDHVVGPADAPVTLVEYGDYQCPDCGEAEPILREVRQRMGGRLRFVFRNFPLTDIHRHALDAAGTAEFAAESGKFWPMHDMLLQNQEALSRTDLAGYAQSLGLDPEGLRWALDDREKTEAFMAEKQDGVESGVQGTPTIFLNGVRYDGAFDAASIIRAASA